MTSWNKGQACCLIRRFKMNVFILWLQTLLKAKMSRVVLVIGMTASMVLAFQRFPIPSKKYQSLLFPTITNPVPGTPESMNLGKHSLLSNSQNTVDLTVLEEVEMDGVFNTTGESDHGSRIYGINEDIDNGNVKLGQSEYTNGGVSLDFEDHLMSEKIRDPGNRRDTTIFLGGSGSTNANSEGGIIPLVKKKKMVMPPVYMPEMNRLLLRNRAAYHSMRPRWSSVQDKDIIATKSQIKNAPIVKNEQELYAPLYRNISIFKRSYELMEQKLKIYIYKEGRKPIFHQPLLDGIYATEGWFMKLMESNKQFVVEDPGRAHLFYMPFSSRYLQLALYIPNSHSRRNIDKHLKDYVDLLASKYTFWNRTGGADHFLVASHDWAPAETRHIMQRSLRGLCNSDLRLGFRLAKDVSVPQTYVRSARNPLKDLGGNPADRRPILAFFAGNMHGSLRPILVQHWENKQPDMKIFSRIPAGIRSKMSYIQHMKSSKYCICPRGYEVNSPRVVESIFYECVPVLISDNFVPPLFDVLNWEAFSVILPEKDVPMLKEVLQSIPEEKYLALQMGVRKVQQHFLWHSKPIKYDMFHMILHSIWYNRVYQIRPR